MLALVQSQRAHDVASGLIAQRNHIADKRIIKPTRGNIVLWRSIYLSEGVIHTDAIRVGLTGGNRVYSGETLPLLDLESDNPFPANSQARQDLQRFSQVSDHWLGIHPECSDMVGDVRYAMLPFSGEPLWGVSIKDVNPESHLKVITNRKFNPSMRQDFIDMLIGGDLAPVN
jgi:inner membrane protein